MTLDQTLQGGEKDIEKIIAILRPDRKETVLLFFQYLLSQIFPWMEPEETVS